MASVDIKRLHSRTGLLSVTQHWDYSSQLPQCYFTASLKARNILNHLQFESCHKHSLIFFCDLTIKPYHNVQSDSRNLQTTSKKLFSSNSKLQGCSHMIVFESWLLPLWLSCHLRGVESYNRSLKNLSHSPKHKQKLDFQQFSRFSQYSIIHSIFPMESTTGRRLFYCLPCRILALFWPYLSLTQWRSKAGAPGHSAISTHLSGANAGMFTHALPNWIIL